MLLLLLHLQATKIKAATSLLEVLELDLELLIQAKSITSDTLSGGKLEIDDIVINNSNIGFSGDQDLITLSNNSVAIAEL